MINPALLERENALTQWLQAGFDNPKLTLELVSGDASFRRYFRVRHHPTQMIAVDAPPPQENCALFLQVAEAYLHAGVRVPKVYQADAEQGFMALEDLGDVMLLDELTLESRDGLYDAALLELPAIAKVRQTCAGTLPPFNATHIARENALFTDWLLGTHLKLELTQAERDSVHGAFAVLTASALAQPQVGVHRDYHARNLMLLKESRAGVIDFQDAVLGPVTYDLVSLLRDCYVEWEDEWVYSKLEQWHQLMVENRVIEPIAFDQLKYWFDLMGIQRHVKASGIFCRLCHRDGKTGYLADVPRTLGYIARVALRYPELEEFGAFVQQKVLPAWHKS